MFCRLKEVFSIDLRSIALVRIFIALIVLTDLATRALDITIFYGDSGVFPTKFVSTFWTGEWAWSLHALFGGPWQLLAALFVFHAIAGLALLVGYRTRIASVATWALLISLHNANPLILQGDDVLLRAVLFVGMFLPWGDVFSIDALRSGRKSKQMQFLSGWSVAYLLQLAFMYFFASLYKHSPEWEGGSAIYYTLSIDQYATPLAKYLLQFPDLLTFLTYSIFIFQSIALFLLFSPYLTFYLRTFAASALIFMHFALALNMHVGMFSSVAMSALLGFIPGGVWDALVSRFNFDITYVKAFMERIFRGRTNVERRLRAPKVIEGAISILGIVYIVYIFFWQAGNILSPGQYVPFGNGWELPAKILRIDQRWNLFAPQPYRYDGWPVIDGALVSGDHVDLFQDGAPIGYEKPEKVFAIYESVRWRRYILHLWNEDNVMYRSGYADYLCRSWNAAHGSETRLKDLDIVYMLEWTPPPGSGPAPIRPVTLLSWDCDRERSTQ